jgi:acyl-coenzyme A synthetase/AMP-(fatty) acid ligase
MRFVVNEKFNNKEKDKIYNYWKNYIGNDVNIEIQIVDDIPLTKSGKRRYLIRNKDIKIEM